MEARLSLDCFMALVGPTASETIGAAPGLLEAAVLPLGDLVARSMRSAARLSAADIVGGGVGCLLALLAAAGAAVAFMLLLLLTASLTAVDFTLRADLMESTDMVEAARLGLGLGEVTLGICRVMIQNKTNKQ